MSWPDAPAADTEHQQAREHYADVVCGGQRSPA